MSIIESIYIPIISYFSNKPVLLISSIVTVIIFTLNKKLDIQGDNLKSLLLLWLVWFFLYSPNNFPDISEGISTIVASGIFFYCIILLAPKKYIKILSEKIYNEKNEKL